MCPLKFVNKVLKGKADDIKSNFVSIQRYKDTGNGENLFINTHFKNI